MPLGGHQTLCLARERCAHARAASVRRDENVLQLGQAEFGPCPSETRMPDRRTVLPRDQVPRVRDRARQTIEGQSRIHPWKLFVGQNADLDHGLGSIGLSVQSRSLLSAVNGFVELGAKT